MCTVSFVSNFGKTIITSNRDEQILRPSAIEPKSYIINNKNIFFPKDPKAGGTWYAVDELGTVLVLLNGADEKHVVQIPYRKSRGLIVLDIISSLNPIDFWQEIDLDNIEPFTLVLYHKEELYQLQWNSIGKLTTNLDIKKKHIWSSATLYPKEIREKRADWFFNYLDKNSEISENEMLHFHKYTEDNNTENGLVINRKGKLKTLSITQSIIDNNKVTIHHNDLIADKNFETSFTII